MSRRAPRSATGLLERSYSPLADRWRAEATVLRRRGALSQADVLESCGAELQEYERERQLEALTLDQAVTESGYSYSALQKMVSDGRLPNVGTPHRPRIKRGYLPKKAGPPSQSSKDEPDLAELVLAGNDRLSHIS